jgi:uncharacterized membrane protein YhhN
MVRMLLIATFMLVLMVDLAGLYFQQANLHAIAKVALMPILMALIIYSKRTTSQRHWKWVLGALVFSWAGDILLLFERSNAFYFIAGLLAFLTAHLLYILYFKRYKLVNAPSWYRKNMVVTLIVAVTSVSLFGYLSPHLGPLFFPVLVYCAVITTMVLMALGIQHSISRKVYPWLASGAVLFMLSDAILAINKFAHPFDAAPILIMLTYGLAQWSIVMGVTKNGDLKIR